MVVVARGMIAVVSVASAAAWGPSPAPVKNVCPMGSVPFVECDFENGGKVPCVKAVNTGALAASGGPCEPPTPQNGCMLQFDQETQAFMWKSKQGTACCNCFEVGIISPCPAGSVPFPDCDFNGGKYQCEPSVNTGALATSNNRCQVPSPQNGCMIDVNLDTKAWVWQKQNDKNFICCNCFPLKMGNSGSGFAQVDARVQHHSNLRHAPLVEVEVDDSAMLQLPVVVEVDELPELGPVIGIASQPLGDAVSYINSWYVRWFEAHGALVVPLFYDAPEEETVALLARVNGVLFPGGSSASGKDDPRVDDRPYIRFTKFVWDRALELNLPLWGICLGFQEMVWYSSGEGFPGPLSRGWDSKHYFAPLNLTQPLPDNSMFADWPESVVQAASSDTWMWHQHLWSVSTEDFARRPALRDFWQVLATNVDRRGLEFISVVEARNGIPFYGTQFHPERSADPWKDVDPEILAMGDGVAKKKRALLTGNPPTSPGAIDAMNRFAAFFVAKARGFRALPFTTKQFWEASILNWSPQFPIGFENLKNLSNLTQYYFFPRWSGPGAAGRPRPPN